MTSFERSDSPQERLYELVERVVVGLGIDGAEVVVTEGDDTLVAEVEGDELGLLIGRAGRTLDAVQHIAQRVTFDPGTDWKRVVIDAAGYVEHRQEKMEELGDRAADQALRYQRPVALDPMRPVERKLLHMYLKSRGDVDTSSDGDEPNRYVIVNPKQ